ncbi:MAG: alpha/beta hydrolase [Lachnospiraceae bacterium]|nr:alpha/beta hydrolase [Lachnospiraceae bacterium]
MRALIREKIQLPVDYAKIGNGPKNLVILPGIALKSTVGSADEIGKLFGLFRDYTIYLIDDRSRVRKGYGLKKRADDVARVLKNNHVTDACVFGASMGGMVAQLLCLRHPELVKKAVFASTSAQPASDMEAMKEASLSDWIRLADQAHLPELIRSMNRLVYSPSTLSAFGEILDAGPGPVSEAELEQFKLLANAVLRYDGLDDLKKILCPVLVVGAKGDRLLGPGASEKLASCGGFELFLYGDEYGHAVYDEAPDFRQRMLDYFEA